MNYFGQWSNLELLRQDGSKRLAADVLRDVPYVVLFFGASWSPECDAFIDVIGNFYEAHHEVKGFEVVYISRDYSRAEMMKSFLLSERASAAAQRRAYQVRKEERAHRRLSAEDGQEGEKKPTVAADVQEGANCQHLNGQDTNSFLEHRKVSSRNSTSPSSIPPPLKRVAELTVNTAASGLAGASVNPLMPCGRRGFWAVPYDHVGCVGVPILYHLRVFTYPGVIVCRNKRFSADLRPALLPPLPAVHQAPAEHSLTLPPEIWPPGGSETQSAQPSLSSPIDRANAPQRRQKTPMVARPECYPDVVTIAGRFMIERDPSGEDFPWDRMNAKTRLAALVFFVIVAVLTVTVLSWALPISQFKRRTALKAPAEL
ncbi:tryparedoxin-like protein [Leishmania donovani]|uniref:Tryparedoxin-like_protein n=3 Tax=Leishmania donovani species complex TaxID=38574 RepID=A0A6L0XNS3_LEIIN|nr:tryparedoxin-like protein [Leishmania infantum JPCM5]XP_003862539.1 tryparedoxin-like protein [Leishmania donovani]CAC9508250.1 tryparedoxin-like_protein [Leishmania infantum]AYU80610.1 tryparedoxin-like protein [Leishmania donovani]TPP52750.1 Thioredoxin-like family protein [Leishmania donovani]CAJ1990593.1 tryparedoxin-like protein [Leishmania donovani]CAM69681.1 tryparedoxin-like protein [Leishmania infantum JPCM5]|eukprot:XP_001466639.1 tryparedoxin-like protein [Leishmania infantum JPCM5]